MVFGGSSNALNPSSQLQEIFVAALQKIMNLLALTPGSSGIADPIAVQNMVLVLTNLQRGVLSSQSAVLESMIAQLNAWLKANGSNSEVKLGTHGSVSSSMSGAGSATSLLGVLSAGASLSGRASVSVAPLILTPVPVVTPATSSNAVTTVAGSSSSVPVSASISVVPASVVAPMGSSSSASSEVPLLVVADLDAVVAAAQARGQTSYNDASSQQALSESLASIASAFSVAGVNNDSNAFSTALKRLLGLIAGALNPSQSVGALFVGGLNQAMSVLAFNVGASGISDVNAFDNLLEIVTYLQNGMLAAHSSTLQIMVDQLNAFLQSH